MLDFLVNHAIENVWCTPEQDYRFIVKPARLSFSLGTFDQHTVEWQPIKLPSKTDRYHLYQIGHVYPKLMGLLGLSDKWVNLVDVVNNSTLMCDVYFSDGVMVPKCDIFVRWTKSKNLIIAVRESNRYLRLRTDAIYVRLYTNAFYNSERYTGSEKTTYVKSIYAANADDMMLMQTQFRQHRDMEGHTFAYRNGVLVDDFIPTLMNNGDALEFVYDRSIRRIVEFDVKDLHVFDSVLDLKRKYLLHPPKPTYETIDFEDDIDIYLIRPLANNHYDGVYYHDNRKDSLRMLTHQDYSVPVSYLEGYQQLHSNRWSDIGDMRIRLCIRHSGYKRPLIQDANRIFELYRLTDEQIVRAMIGIDSVVDEWNAIALEQSPYVRLMRAYTSHLDPVHVQQAYGYNSMAKLTGDTPLKIDPLVEGEFPKVTLLPGQRTDVTIYQYDSNGHFIGRFYHANGLVATCPMMGTRMVEVIPGRGSNELDVVFGQTAVETDPRYNYRAYLCTTIAGAPQWDWVDVSNTEIISVANNQIVFTPSIGSDYTAVMSDRRFLADTYTLAPNNGVLTLTISSLELHFSETQQYISTIPPRKLDVWLNGKPLIEKLDYYVEWPKIVIVNKEYLLLDGDQMQTIEVRGVGFANDDMTMDSARESGFVQHGFLSANGRYDIRSDKVLSAVVGGRLKTISELDFAEDSLGVSVHNVPNGTPYAIRETVIPMRGYTYLDTYQLRDIARETDERISNYMTLKFPEPVIDELSPITERYMVYSPFLSRLIYDLQNHIFDNTLITANYSNRKIREWMRPYERWLPFDPAHVGVDDNYVKVHPHAYVHALDLTWHQFSFVKRVSELYFNDRVDINHFFNIVLPGEVT